MQSLVPEKTPDEWAGILTRGFPPDVHTEFTLAERTSVSIVFYLQSMTDEGFLAFETKESFNFEAKHGCLTRGIKSWSQDTGYPGLATIYMRNVQTLMADEFGFGPQTVMAGDMRGGYVWGRILTFVPTNYLSREAVQAMHGRLRAAEKCLSASEYAQAKEMIDVLQENPYAIWDIADSPIRVHYKPSLITWFFVQSAEKRKSLGRLNEYYTAGVPLGAYLLTLCDWQGVYDANDTRQRKRLEILAGYYERRAAAIYEERTGIRSACSSAPGTRTAGGRGSTPSFVTSPRP